MIAFQRPAWWTRIGHIRGRLILLAVVAAAPIAGMAGLIAYQEFNAALHGATERAALLEGQGLAQYRTVVAGIDSQLQLMTPAITGGRCDDLSQLRPREADIAGLLSIDIDGKVICRAGDLPGVEPRPRTWFEQARGGEPQVLGRDGPDGPVVLAIRGPSGTVAAAFLRPDWVALNMLPDPGEGSSVFWLLDPARAVVASRGNAADALPDVAGMVTLIGSGQRALLANSARDLRYAYATSLLPGGWRLIAATSARNEHAQAVHGLILRMAELALLLLIGTAAVAIGADVAFGTPLRRLAAAVRRWQSGGSFDPGNLLGAPDEVLDLSTSFRDATTVLRDKQAELSRAREQQELLVMEIHHRVKNNLQVIASLLNLQASRIRVPEARAEFQAARDRVRALATLHRHLYADGGLHTINMRSFLTELCGQLFHAMGEKEDDRIQLSIEAPELRMSSDQAVPLALIVTEAVTNSVKYAFPGGRSGHVSVSLRENDGALDLVISDDGVGIPSGRSETESGTRDGLGLQLIRGFSRQLGASLQVDEGAGTRYAVRLAKLPAAAGADG